MHVDHVDAEVVHCHSVYIISMSTTWSDGDMWLSESHSFRVDMYAALKAWFSLCRKLQFHSPHEDDH